MKRMKYFALVTAFLCGIGLFSSCVVSNDNPVPDSEQEAKENRQLLIRHIEKDAKLLAENFNVAAFDATSQAYAQLLAMIQLDRNFVKNMNTVLSTISDNQSLLSISPVQAGTELAQMGYLLFITVNNGDFGVRVILDGKRNSRVSVCDHLEFIFPATVAGIGTTLFKLIVKNSNDCYETVSDVNIGNLKRVACVNRLPKSFTMTLNGYIDNQELTLSESVVNLELPQKESSQYVDLTAQQFKLKGQQSSYMKTSNQSALNFCLSLDGDDMNLDYNYTRNGMEIVGCDAQMKLSQKGSFIEQMTDEAFNIADLKAVTIRILNDLVFAGSIDNGTDFAKDFAQAIKNREQATSPEVLEPVVESLNASCHFQLSCEQMTKPEDIHFCLVQKDDKYMIEPALRRFEGIGLIPLSELVDQQTLIYINGPFKESFTPAGNTVGSALKFYSVFMRMMPFSRGRF